MQIRKQHKLIVSYRGAPRIRGWETGALVAKAFRQLGHQVFEYGNIYQSEERLGNAPDLKNEFDLLIYMECNDGDSQYTELKNVKARKKVSWFFDVSYYRDNLVGFSNFFNFDCNFIANPLYLNKFKNSVYLPYAAAEIHYRPGTFPKKYDIALVGSDRPERRALIDQLKKAGLDAHLISGVFKEDYIDALASAKIIVNQNPPEGRGLLNMRHFESLAAGCVLVEQWDDLAPNVVAGFGPPLAFTYDTRQRDDLIKICFGILDNVEYSVSMAQSEFLKFHTYENRCKTMLETV